MNKPILTSLLLVLLLNVSCKNQTPAEEIKQTFVLSDKMLETTKTAVAENKTLQNELTFHGKITTDNNKFIEIFPIVGGSVNKVYVELGDYVKKGQLLATIKSTEVAGFEKELEDLRESLTEMTHL